MSKHHATCLYQEARLNATPASSESVVEFSLPAHSANAHAHRPTPKRRRIEKPAATPDEEVFARHQLATEAHIHFRHHPNSPKGRTSPHSILWRILDDRKVLELQAVDLYHDPSETQQYGITLRFEFYSTIRPKGVTFAETSEGPSGPLVVFIVTKLGELYELKIPRQAFARPDVLDEAPQQVNKWFSSDVPNAISYHAPHTILARSDSELWASLSDGGLVRLERRLSSEGEVTWQESWFSEGSWTKAISRALIPWGASTTVSFDNIKLSAKTALAIAAAPDGRHIWTACLDHTLKAWDVSTGKIVLNFDLAGDLSRDMEKPIDRLLDPGHSNLLNIVPSKNGSPDYTVAVFSPWTRQFKFWKIRDAEAAEHGVADMHADFEFIPPIEDLLDTNVWTLEEFCIKPFNDGRRKDWTLWVLVRSGSRCHTLHCHFNPNDSQNGLSKAWRTHWSDVSPGLLAADALDLAFAGPAEWTDEVLHTGPQALVSKWLDFLFNPGRFTDATLETALTVYRRSLAVRGRRHFPSLIQDTRPLMERVADAIGSDVVLGRHEDRAPAYEAYNKAVAAQWYVFYGVVKDLHKRRETVLALALDPEHDMPWIIMSGLVSPVRACAEIDALSLNRAAYSRPDLIPHDSSLLHSINRGNVELGSLFHAVKSFRKTMSGSFLQSFRFALEVALVEKPNISPFDRLVAVYDLASFDVSNDDYNALLAALDSGLGGFSRLSNAMIAAALELLQEEHRGNHQKRALSAYGFKALVRNSQELLQTGLELLSDLLLLIVFIGGELEEQDMPTGLEPGEAFDALMTTFRQYYLLHWLASKTITIRDISKKGSNIFDSKPQGISTMALSEWLFSGDFDSISSPSSNDAELLTYWSRLWTLAPPVNQEYDEFTADILGRLLKHGELHLAQQFVRFASHDPWSTYVRSRLLLVQGEYYEASTAFRRLGPELDGNFAVQEYDRSGLLTILERGHFNSCLTNYYQHVVALFEKVKAMSFVGEFAVLGLKSLESELADGTFSGDSTAARTDLVSRLFTSYIKTSRFAEAYNTLQMHTDAALYRASLQAFLSSILARNQTNLLLSLPISDDIAEEIDEQLASLVTTSDQPVADPNGAVTAPHKVLYAWRISRNDMRGAALCLWDHLQRLRQAQDGGLRGLDIEGEIATAYLSIINCLSIIEPEMAWILVRPLASIQKGRLSRVAPPQPGVRAKRKIVTLEQVRKEWQQELDRMADIEAGRFALPLDVMEQDDDEDVPNGHANGGMKLDVAV